MLWSPGKDARDLSCGGRLADVRQEPRVHARAYGRSSRERVSYPPPKRDSRAAVLVLIRSQTRKPDNVKTLMAQPEIDGVLVGGASLEAGSLAAIVNF